MRRRRGQREHVPRSEVRTQSDKRNLKEHTANTGKRAEAEEEAGS